MVRAAHETLLGSQTPAEPYVKNSPDGHTVSMTRFEDWTNFYVDAFKKKFDFDWQYTHHNICATMLTHALAQGDF
jgi:hypothetical protein